MTSTSSAPEMGPALLLAAAYDAVLLRPGGEESSQLRFLGRLGRLALSTPTGATTSIAAATATAPATNCASTAPAAGRRWRGEGLDGHEGRRAQGGARGVRGGQVWQQGVWLWRRLHATILREHLEAMADQ
eukprot:4607739-Prymnesium_polylepis.2